MLALAGLLRWRASPRPAFGAALVGALGAVWLPLVIGVAIFAIWAFATSRYIQSHHLAADLTGVQEGTTKISRGPQENTSLPILLLPRPSFTQKTVASVER